MQSMDHVLRTRAMLILLVSNICPVKFISVGHDLATCMDSFHPKRSHAIRRVFARGVSYHELGTLASSIVSTLSASTFALVFKRHPFSAIHLVFCVDSAIQSVLYTEVELSSLFSARISNSASNCCSNNCFLSEQCAREAASPGAP